MSTPSGKTVLFVCTGNTCRSPMAAAIAEDLIVRSDGSVRHVHALSAGVSAATGAPMTPEAGEALRRIGVDPPGHRATALTRDLVASADVIYGMTNRHVEAVTQIDPEAASKTHTLDPSGADVMDPLGQPLEIYNLTAERLKTLVSARLEELKEQ